MLLDFKVAHLIKMEMYLFVFVVFLHMSNVSNLYHKKSRSIFWINKQEGIQYFGCRMDAS